MSHETEMFQFDFETLNAAFIEAGESHKHLPVITSINNQLRYKDNLIE